MNGYKVFSLSFTDQKGLVSMSASRHITGHGFQQNDLEFKIKNHTYAIQPNMITRASFETSPL